MNIFLSVRNESARLGWAPAGSIVITLAIVALIAAAFVPRAYSGRWPSVLLALVLVALCAAIAFHARFLLLARRQHGETARVLDSTEREFQSIFDSALAGTLISD